MSRDILSKSLNPDKSTVKPSFSVHKNGASQLNINGTQKVTWPTEEFDTNSNFASDRFTPTIEGKYLLAATLHWFNLGSGQSIYVWIYKNGAPYKREGTQTSSVNNRETSITAVVNANGTGDYFEIYAYNVNVNTSDIHGGSENTYFTGCKID